MPRRRAKPKILPALSASSQSAPIEPQPVSTIRSDSEDHSAASSKQAENGPAPNARRADASLVAACARLVPRGPVTASAITELRKAAVNAGPDSLPFFAVHYLDECAAGGSPNTLDAKSRDLRSFIGRLARENAALTAHAWRPRDTRAFVAELLNAGRKPTTINRSLATLRHFARWLQDRHLVFGTLGLPTRDVKDVATEELECRKLSDDELAALFDAGKERVRLIDSERVAAAKAGRRDPTGRRRARRDLAILAALYYAGLRVSEIIALRTEQYNKTHLLDVARKGRNVTRRIFLAPEGCRIIDDYILNERPLDAAKTESNPLFASTGNNGHLLRSDVAVALQRLVAEANKLRTPERQIHLSPHKVRHTFGSRVRKTTGSDFETAVALGHQSIQHVGRYTRPSDDEREQTLRAALRLQI